jgi:hypothetical protein
MDQIGAHVAAVLQIETIRHAVPPLGRAVSGSANPGTILTVRPVRRRDSASRYHNRTLVVACHEHSIIDGPGPP